MPSQRFVLNQTTVQKALKLGVHLLLSINNRFLENLIFSFFLQEQGAKPASEPMPTQANPPAPAELPVEVADETWEQKEDKQNAEPDKSKGTPEPTEQKYQYKQGMLWKLKRLKKNL